MKIGSLVILLVDDDRAANTYNEYILRKMNISERIDIAENGEEALAYLKSKDSDGNHPKPDMVFLDINMPVMGGWEFLEEYEKLPEEQRAGMVVVMLTTSINADDREMAARNPNIKGFRSKPLNAEMVIEIINEHLSVDEQ